MQTDTQGGRKRTETRRLVSLNVYALSSDRDADVTVTDISYGGCGISSETKFNTGERIQLNVVRRGVMQEEIRWVEGKRAGARFAN